MSSHIHRPLSTLPATVIGPQLSKGWKVSNWMWVSIECSVSFWDQPHILTPWTACSRLQRSSFSASFWCSREELLLPTLSEASGVAPGGRGDTRRQGGGSCFSSSFSSSPPAAGYKYLDSSWQDRLDLRRCSKPLVGGHHVAVESLKYLGVLQLRIVGVWLCRSGVWQSCCVRVCFVVDSTCFVFWPSVTAVGGHADALPSHLCSATNV